MQDDIFNDLIAFILRIPSVKKGIGKGIEENGIWWVKFQIDIEHELVWQVIQELSCVVNYLSLNERLPTVFYPVSPAPYLNGGPKDYLSWVIETKVPDFLPDDLKEWLANRLPSPVDDKTSWEITDDE